MSNSESHWEESASLWANRWLRWSVYIIAGLILATVLAFWVENWRGKRAWENYKKEMAAKGEVLDWEAYIPAPIPEEENIFAAPNMSFWFSKRNGTANGFPINFNGMPDFILARQSNAMAQITIVSPNEPVILKEGEILLSYDPPTLSLADTNTPVASKQTNEVIPLIVMEEVSLTDAIKHLAKQAEINYQLDPKVTAERKVDGSRALDAKVTLRWTDMTAKAALLAVLDNHNLQLVGNPKTLIGRIVKKDSFKVQTMVESGLRDRLTKIVEDAMAQATNSDAGKSFVGVQDFMIYAKSAKPVAPVRMIIRAESVPDEKVVASLFPGDVRAADRTPSDPRATATGSNTFEVYLNPKTHVTAADFLAWSDQYETEFATVREAVKRPHAWLVGDYKFPPDMPVPNFVAMRVMAQTLAQRAQCQLLLNDPEKALRELTLIHDMCRMLEAKPSGKPITLVAAMINSALSGLYVSTIADGLRLQVWGEPQLATIQTQLREIDLLPSMVMALEADRASTFHLYENTDAEEYMRLYGRGTRKSFADSLKDSTYVILAFAPKGWVYQNMVKLGQLNQMAIEGIDCSKRIIQPQNLEKMKRGLEEISVHPNPYNVLAHVAVPNFRTACLRLAYNQTLANEAQIVCALERYRLAKGQYPETLEMLVPQFIEKLPHDIIGGQALKYRREGERFLLYSIGWNEKDEGGVVAPKKDGSTYLEKGDWVWPYREKLSL